MSGLVFFRRADPSRARIYWPGHLNAGSFQNLLDTSTVPHYIIINNDRRSLPTAANPSFDSFLHCSNFSFFFVAFCISFHSIRFISVVIDEQWRVRARGRRLESTWAQPTPASESGSTTASRSSPTTRATAQPLPMSASPTPSASSATPPRIRSPWTPSTPSSVPSFFPSSLSLCLFLCICSLCSLILFGGCCMNLNLSFVSISASKIFCCCVCHIICEPLSCFGGCIWRMWRWSESLHIHRVYLLLRKWYNKKDAFILDRKRIPRGPL